MAQIQTNTVSMTDNSINSSPSAGTGNDNTQNVPNPNNFGTPQHRHGRFAADAIAHRRTTHAASNVSRFGHPSTPSNHTPSNPQTDNPQTEQTAVHTDSDSAIESLTDSAVDSSPSGSKHRFEPGNYKPIMSKTSVRAEYSADYSETSDTLPIRLPIDVPFEKMRLLMLAIVMIPLCIFASFPSWESMVYEWWHTDDYSHGFLVIPATILFLYMRWDTYPGTCHKLDWLGLFPILLYGVFRIFAGLRYLDPLDAFAIWFWILGIVWFFYGGRVFLWALPSLCFLIFMFQLPWRIDVLMRGHLQFFAAHFAAILLTFMNVTAIPIKNTIQLSTLELGVEQACSGLRFLMSVFAIALATVLLLRRPWWQNVLILAIAAPLALFVNAVRIAITGILLENHYTMVSTWTAEGQSAAVAADSFAGKVAIFLALGLFALFVWFLGKIFKRVEF